MAIPTWLSHNQRLAELTNKSILLTTSEGLDFFVRVTDLREVFGRTQAKVRPDSGTGREAWVDFSRLQVR